MARKYKPVTIEAQLPDGSWAVRNAFLNDNAEVRAGSMKREVLIDKAHRVMIQWIVTYDQGMSLRIGGR
jgi:hypothetical protein